MDLDPSEARFRVERQGQTIYFCSQSCMTKFDRDPEKYSGHASRR